MNRRARAILVLLLFAAVTSPLLTAHALWPTIWEHEHQNGVTLYLELLLLGGLTLLSALSLLGVLRGIVHWLRALYRLRYIREGATAARWAGVPYLRIAGDQVTLFTAGILRPQIYASRGAERGLSPEAFTAALFHEQAHVRHRDPFWLAILVLAEASAGWFPMTRRAFADLRLHMEWNADRTALNAGAERQGLFDAIATAAVGAQWVAPLSGDGAMRRLRWLADPELQSIAEPGVSPALTGLFMPPLVAHALVWTGLVCGLCALHFW